MVVTTDKNASGYLFVYGTLMQAFNNPFADRLRALSDYAGEGWLPGRLYRVSWYPGAIYQQDHSGKIWGELYRMYDGGTLLEELDAYEEIVPDVVASPYVRRILPVFLENGAIITSWVYLYNQSVQGVEEIASGRFT